MTAVQAKDFNEQPERLEPMEKVIARNRQFERDHSVKLIEQGTDDAARLVASLQDHPYDLLRDHLERGMRQIAKQAGERTLNVVVVHGHPPAVVSRDLDKQAALAGSDEIPTLVFVAAEDAFGLSPRRAWAFIDVSDCIWRD